MSARRRAPESDQHRAGPEPGLLPHRHRRAPFLAVAHGSPPPCRSPFAPEASASPRPLRPAQARADMRPDDALLGQPVDGLQISRPRSGSGGRIRRPRRPSAKPDQRNVRADLRDAPEVKPITSPPVEGDAAHGFVEDVAADRIVRSRPHQAAGERLHRLAGSAGVAPDARRAVRRRASRRWRRWRSPSPPKASRDRPPRDRRRPPRRAPAARLAGRDRRAAHERHVSGEYLRRLKGRRRVEVHALRHRPQRAFGGDRFFGKEAAGACPRPPGRPAFEARPCADHDHLAAPHARREGAAAACAGISLDHQDVGEIDRAARTRNRTYRQGPGSRGGAIFHADRRDVLGDGAADERNFTRRVRRPASRRPLFRLSAPCTPPATPDIAVKECDSQIVAAMGDRHARRLQPRGVPAPCAVSGSNPAL